MSLKKLLYANVLVKLLDLLTTFYLVSVHGTGIESHPFTANMIQTYGVVPGLLINGTVHMMLIASLYGFKQKGLLIVAGILTATFPLINFVTILETIGGF